MNQPTLISSQELEALHSRPDGPDSERLDSASVKPIRRLYSESHGAAADDGPHRGGGAKAQREATKKAINAAARTAQAKARRTSLQLYAPYTADIDFKSETQPGETRWSVISRISKHIGVAAWMTSDGQLCVSRPDYNQAPVGKLFTHMDNEGNTTDSNCLMSISLDTGNRHSDYLCLGQGRQNATSAGVDLAGFTANARDPSRAFWWVDPSGTSSGDSPTASSSC